MSHTNPFVNAHKRIKQQRQKHVHVIIGNPPYSAKQSNYNNDDPNVEYPILDGRIKKTYVQHYS